MTLQELVAWLNTRRGGDVVTPTRDLDLSEAGRAEFHQRCDSASPAWTTRGLARPYLQPTATVTWASMVLAMVIFLPATGFTQEGTQLTQSIQAQSRVGDFDGDASSDLAVFRPSTGQWLIFNSGTLTSSEYTWGGAADIYIDPKDNDRMEDLNRDGRVDIDDAKYLYDRIEELFAATPLQKFEGGLGFYPATAAHPPFVHVDVRGTRARWKG